MEEAFKIYLRKEQLKLNTIKEHLKNIKYFNSWCEKDGIEVDHTSYTEIVAYVGFLRGKGLSIAVIQHRIRSIKYYLSYLMKEGVREDNPARLVDIKKGEGIKIVETLTDNQLEAIYDDFANYEVYPREKDQQAHLRHLIILGLLIYQAATSRDLKALLVDDFNLLNGSVLLEEKVGVSARKLPLEAKQILPISRYIETLKGDRFIVGSIRDILLHIKRKLIKIGYENINLQVFRNSKIVIWLNREHIRRVQYLAGFRYISSLEKYRLLETETLKEEIKQYHPLV